MTTKAAETITSFLSDTDCLILDVKTKKCFLFKRVWNVYFHEKICYQLIENPALKKKKTDLDLHTFLSLPGCSNALCFRWLRIDALALSKIQHEGVIFLKIYLYTLKQVFLFPNTYTQDCLLVPGPPNLGLSLQGKHFHKTRNNDTQCFNH